MEQLRAVAACRPITCICTTKLPVSFSVIQVVKRILVYELHAIDHAYATHQVVMRKLDAVLDDLAKMCGSPAKARQVLPTLGAVEPSKCCYINKLCQSSADILVKCCQGRPGQMLLPMKLCCVFGWMNPKPYYHDWAGCVLMVLSTPFAYIRGFTDAGYLHNSS